MPKPLAQNSAAESFHRHIDRFPQARVLVVGDLILDEYLWGAASRISPEAPVPVVDVRRETCMPGGAANVVVNMTSLGARPLLCGVVGRDPAGDEILALLEKRGLSTEGVAREADRPSSVKTRVVAQHQQVVRFDRETRQEIRPESTRIILDFIERELSNLDILVVSDYGKGVVSAPLMQRLRPLARSAAVRVAVDPKTGNFEHYRGVDVITPNHHEAGTFCGFDISDDEGLQRAGRMMLRRLRSSCVLITQGQDGMTLFEDGGVVVRIPTVARRVYDVTGAGDTVIATFALALASGLDPKSAAFLSNCAAGIVVGEVGTAAVRVEELKGVIATGAPP